MHREQEGFSFYQWPARPNRAVESLMWKGALVHALAFSGSILALFYYWFAVADRYAIFLYNHLGATPFDEQTRSRYWMCGLVASGAVLTVYTFFNWFVGRTAVLRKRTYDPPAWWRIWLLCVAPLAVGIPLITMKVNQPTLPWPLALSCVIATLSGLALALLPGAWAARQPFRLALLAVTSLGLVPCFLLVRVVELPGFGLLSKPAAYAVAIGSATLGAIWLVGLAFLQARWWKYLPQTWSLYLGGLCWSYLLLPLAHYLFLTPPEFRYISVAENFFARTLWAQMLSFLTALVLAAVINHRYFHPIIKKAHENPTDSHNQLYNLPKHHLSRSGDG